MKRRQYTPEFKAEVVRMVLSGHTQAHVGQLTGVALHNISRWMSTHRKHGVADLRTYVPATATAPVDMSKLMDAEPAAMTLDKWADRVLHCQADLRYALSALDSAKRGLIECMNS